MKQARINLIYDVLVPSFVTNVHSMLERNWDVEVFFDVVRSRDVLRKRLYEEFGGHPIEINFLDRVPDDPSETHYKTSASVIIRAEKIRTSATPGIAASEPKHTGTLQDSFEIKKCPICERALPLNFFELRFPHSSRKVRQSYCKGCRKLYDHWYSAYLRQHGASRLTPIFTKATGGKEPNRIFRNWYCTISPEAKQQILEDLGYTQELSLPKSLQRFEGSPEIHK